MMEDGVMDRSKLTKKMNLLVIDDETTVSRATARCLRNSWRDISFASNAEEGLNAIRSGKFDVALSDWDCPEGGGQRIVQNSTIPVVIHTGNSDVPNICNAKVVMKGSLKDAINKALVDAWLNFPIK